MYLLKSFVIAVSMYSKIPMPKVDWNEKNMRYPMCFFPVVGGITGILEVILGRVILQAGAGKMFFAVFMTLVPIVVTGGIHMDGFMDTVDALSSYGDREKKLDILKDSHAGAFAILGLCCYLLWNVALWGEVKAEYLPVIGCTFVISRSLSGFSVVTFPPARENGLVRTFRDGASRKRVRIVMVVWIALVSMLVLFLNPLMGSAVLLAAFLVFSYYRRVCLLQFGGVTGDLAGYFLQISELAMLTAAVIAGGVL